MKALIVNWENKFATNTISPAKGEGVIKNQYKCSIYSAHFLLSLYAKQSPAHLKG